MGRNTASLKRLADMAREPAPERREDLVRYVADLFLLSPDRYSQAEIDQFGDILGVGIKGVDANERLLLAERLALVPNAPRNVMNALARDEIDVADPVLMQSEALTDDDLVDIVARQSPPYARAVSLRESLSPKVTDALIATGDAEVLESLAENSAADFSRGSMAALVAWSERLPAMQLALLERDDMPLDLLGQMYFFLAPVLRQRVLEVVASLFDEDIQREMEAGEYTASELPPHLAAVVGQRHVSQDEMVRFLARRETDKFAIAFAHLTGFTLSTCERVLTCEGPEALALVSKAAGFSRTTYCALTTLVAPTHEVEEQALVASLKVLDFLPDVLCDRMVRLWRVAGRTRPAQPAAHAA